MEEQQQQQRARYERFSFNAKDDAAWYNDAYIVYLCLVCGRSYIVYELVYGIYVAICVVYGIYCTVHNIFILFTYHVPA